MNFDNDCIEEYESLLATLDRGDVRFKLKKYELDMKYLESPPAKPCIEVAPKLELKDLPSHLRYKILGNGNTLMLIIASDLNEQQFKSFVKVLKWFKRSIVWNIVDIIGIPPVIFSHKIQHMPDHNQSIEHQKRLNPPMQEVLKKNIIKWLNAT